MEREMSGLGGIDQAEKGPVEELDQLSNGPSLLSIVRTASVPHRLEGIITSVSRFARIDRASVMASCQALAECGSIGRIEEIMLACAAPEFARAHRIRNAGVYFENWRILREWVHLTCRAELDQLERDGEWLRWLRTQSRYWKARYYLAALALAGFSYRHGRRINPGRTLDRLTQLL